MVSDLMCRRCGASYHPASEHECKLKREDTVYESTLSDGSEVRLHESGDGLYVIRAVWHQDPVHKYWYMGIGPIWISAKALTELLVQ